MDNGQVTFQYKQYRTEDRQKSKQMTLSADEFIRRFLLHSLPPGFQRIRHYGLLASRGKLANPALCRKYLNAPPVETLPAPGAALSTMPDRRYGAHPVLFFYGIA